MEIQKVAEAVEAEAKKIEGEVVVVAKKVEEEVVKEVKKLVQEITSDEKLAIREIENSYLKAQIEINRLSQITQKAQGDFTRHVEALTKKYVISPAEFVFDNVELIFRRK